MTQRVAGRMTTQSEPRASGAWPWWRAVAAVEVSVGATVVFLDIPPASPTFALLALLVLSLVVRRRGLRSLGLVRVERFGRMAATVLGLAVAWSVVNLGLTMPVLEHATGQRKDFSQFEGLQGDLGMLLGLVGLSWTLAAFGEELAYRGLLFTRTRDLVEAPRLAVVAAVVVSSTLFGMAHTEQGMIGVVVTGLDAVFLSALMLHFKSLWAPILAHGFNNTIGLTAVHFVGPIHGWW